MNSIGLGVRTLLGLVMQHARHLWKDCLIVVWESSSFRGMSLTCYRLLRLIRLKVLPSIVLGGVGIHRLCGETVVIWVVAKAMLWLEVVARALALPLHIWVLVDGPYRWVVAGARHTPVMVRLLLKLEVVLRNFRMTRAGDTLPCGGWVRICMKSAEFILGIRRLILIIGLSAGIRV